MPSPETRSRVPQTYSLTRENPLPGIRLESVFQPIFSVAHHRTVGYEALLRGTNERGERLPPSALLPALVSALSSSDANETLARLHLSSFVATHFDGWLFLNFSPDALQSREHILTRFEDWLFDSEFPAHRVVIEIVETRTYDEQLLADAVEGFRELGCLVAIDDFGAGESNFERVWRLRPHLVKLDRAMLEEAVRNPLVLRLLPGLVELIHEAGSLVVLEGIETEAQALIAVESGVDFVQGYYFAAPHHEPPSPQLYLQQFERLAALENEHHATRLRDTHEFRRAYLERFAHCCAYLSNGSSLPEACQTFLSLRGVQCVYVLDSLGRQVSQNLEPETEDLDRRFNPCRDATGANWFRRPYFQRALAARGEVQTSTPYLSLRNASTCITLSVTYRLNHETFVLCADIDPWEGSALPATWPTPSDPSAPDASAYSSPPDCKAARPDE